MSATSNPNSLQGEFHSRVPRSEPMEKGGHAPGVLVGNDRIPEFHAETHPAGTAPREDTYQPRPEGENAPQATHEMPRASDTMSGATSQSVYAGMGKPVQGQERREIEKPHGGHRKKEHAGTAGVGGVEGVDFARAKGAESVQSHEGGKLKGAEFLGAEDRVPDSA
ncbi:hypothetical protein F4808DRAFT_41035 [Astrocystis sublimbata]|nr:hypothetical protein F4808DRAFT_41035 [Astrocystis sublimbata]